VTQFEHNLFKTMYFIWLFFLLLPNCRVFHTLLETLTYHRASVVVLFSGSVPVEFITIG